MHFRALMNLLNDFGPKILCKDFSFFIRDIVTLPDSMSYNDFFFFFFFFFRHIKIELIHQSKRIVPLSQKYIGSQHLRCVSP